MKVLWFVNTEFPDVAISKGRISNTGNGSWMKVLCHFLKDAGINLHIACAGPWYLKKEVLVINNITYHCIPRNKYFHNFSARKIDIKNIIAVANTVQPDLIHVFGTEQFYGLIVDKVNFPVIIRLQGSLNACVKNYFGHLQKAKLLRYPMIFLIWFFFYQKKEQEKKIIRLNKNFEGQTLWDYAWLKKENNNANYFRNAPILRKQFYTNQWKYELCTPFSILSVMSTVPFKGIHYLIDVISKIKIEFPNVHLYLLHKLQKNGYSHLIRKKIQQLSLNENITFLGTLDENALCKQLLKTNVFINPSFVENESLVRLEAMSLGTPVICSYVGGMANTLNYSEDGLYFPVGNAEMLAELIRYVFNNPEKVQMKCKNLQLAVREYLDKKKIVDKTIEMYKSVNQCKKTIKNNV